MNNMTKKILISMLIIVGISGVASATEAYQGELSDKKLSKVSKINNSVAINQAKHDQNYTYDKEYEDLLTHIDTSYSDDYELDLDKLNDELNDYESHYEELLAGAEKIIGKEKVDSLSRQVDKVATAPKKKSKKIIKIKQLDDLKKTKDNLEVNYNKAKDLDADSDGENIYQSLLDQLKTDKKIDGMFESSDDNLDEDSDIYKYKMDNGFPLQEIMTVGLFTGEKKRFKKCLILKKYGAGTWRTYCQPLAKPTKCSDQEWRDLSTMPVMYC